MITWFSAGVPWARRTALGLGLLWLGAGPARADEPAAAPPPALGPKVVEKQAIAEARLAAARAKAGAQREAEARALYGEALAASLAAQAQAFADQGAPRPSTVVSPANEQPALEEPEAPTAAASAGAEAARLAQREQMADEQAAREALARQQDEARRRDDEARREAARLDALAPVPVLVAPAAPAAPPARPLAFQVGYVGALQATDPTGGKHASSGLMFTWLTFASAYGRGSVVVDLESTRLQAGRSDMTDRSQAAFYGLGFDWTVPFASHGTGVFVGAEAVGGVLQSSRMTSDKVGTDGVLQVMPHAGAAVAYRGFGLFADAGWRFQLLADDATSGKASLGGFVVQGGLRVEMEPGAAREAPSLDVGYVARVYGPNGSRVYARYGLGGAGPLYQSEVVVSTNALMPRVLHMDNGLAFTYLGAGQDGGGGGLHVASLGWLATFHAFATHQLFNPYAGLRLAAAYISNDDPSTFQYSKQIGLVASGIAGVDVGLHRRFVLRLGVAYDGVAYANDVADASLSGYALEAGLLVRL